MTQGNARMAQVVVVVAPTKEERWREGEGGGEENEGDTGATHDKVLFGLSVSLLPLLSSVVDRLISLLLPLPLTLYITRKH